ncbi:zinc-binding dehydrogenase [Aliiglaciecola sp. LCG003]|uniref:zinc-binding dehydrogenase n=1 Tax=Aliiglaciecola sp. LCG003 TaxID=3053655 RepID=UPI002573E918|nr:zinc-binding dehydrogenase [Aliiglaciecola sp. LCG003]WJG10601.1 zinc-binding dehydrogenase [Aliiglaciecola sp. LCG003]
MMKFSAAVLTKIGNPLELIDAIQVPVLKVGQVLVKIIYSGVCHSQLMEASGARGQDRYLPHMLGHEATAEVLDVGPETTKIKAGDKVILGWLKGTGIDAGGTVYQSPIGKINAGAVTTFSQLSVVSENRCYLLPDNISLREGVLLGCALPTGMGMVNNQINCQPEHSIGVFGLGGIGMSALIAAVNCQAKLVVAIDTNEDKLKLARKLGAHVCINPMAQDASRIIAEQTSGKLLDFIIEAAGTCSTIEQAFSVINKNTGKCIFASHPKHGDKICLDPYDLICGKKIEGSWGGQTDPEIFVQQVAQQRNHDSLKELVSNTYHLQDINQAMADLTAQKVLRAIVAMESTL